MVFQRGVPSPLGDLTILGDGVFVTALKWGASQGQDDDPVLVEAGRQLGEYFGGQRQDFDLPLLPQPTEFAARFQAALNAISFGHTRTYGELAADLGVSPQAIGQACGANKIPIIVPCHRVLGADNLGGYSGDGGIDSKVWLLRHEGAGGLLI